MKKIMLWGLILCAALSAPAQTGEEWLRQKETQKKYLLEQIAALKVYLGHAKKGYAIAAVGWRMIQQGKEGDLSLHRAFFGALSQVNPRVKASPFVGATITLQSQIVEQIKNIKNFLRTTPQLTSSELKFCHALLDGLLQESRGSLEELGLLTTSGALELSDNERLERLRRLYESVQELYKSTCSFCADIQLLTARRWREQVELHHQRKAIGGK